MGTAAGSVWPTACTDMGTSPSILQDKIVQYEREREERVRAYDREREERLNRFTRERAERLTKYEHEREERLRVHNSQKAEVRLHAQFSAGSDVERSTDRESA